MVVVWHRVLWEPFSYNREPAKRFPKKDLKLQVYDNKSPAGKQEEPWRRFLNLRPQQNRRRQSSDSPT